MRPKAQERGQALVIIALAAIGLFGFSALAIDGSRVFSDRRHAQSAADNAALSAALAKIRQEDHVQAAKDRAGDNGYVFNATTNNVQVNFCNAAGLNPPCQGIPTINLNSNPPPTTEEIELATPANYIQVKITSILPATFARIVGRNEFTNIVTAIAYAGPVEPKPLADGYALAAMELHDSNAISTNGNISVDINNSGIFSNSDYISNPNNCNQGSMSAGGNGTISVDTSILTVGSFCSNGNSVIQPSNAVDEGASQIDLPPTVSIPNFSCSSAIVPATTDSVGRTIVPPGSHGNLNFGLGDEVIFSPGTHCFNNGLNLSNGEDVIADHVKFRFNGGNFKINGGTLTCNDMQVHINGGSGIDVSATSHVYCNNVTFFLSTGEVRWNGTADLRIYAPTGGDYEGLLFYMPPSNSNPITINGSTSSQLTGTILAVSSHITINGNNWSTGFNSQVIGDTVSLEGNGNLVINFNPDDQYQPIDPSVITLTK